MIDLSEATCFSNNGRNYKQNFKNLQKFTWRLNMLHHLLFFTFVFSLFRFIESFFKSFFDF